ncbi:hypothetical protein EVAR_88670_1 [Eumeta japonica]|uniref:Uncharacterized protein n=1 Tax=Eumeta variegata TaxID=151549 RepID=A0A4C1YBH8_EUMVA|nr:hypothetical protein EVAR_88670_1 [Eumeta japonica]
MINHPGSSSARRSFQTDSRAKNRVLLEADPRLAGSYEFSKLALTQDHSGIFTSIASELSKYCFCQIVDDSTRFEYPERRNVKRERAREIHVRKPRPLQPH